MKIACVIHSLDGGGAERVMAGLASRLAIGDHEIELITLDDGERNRHSLDESVRRVPLDVLSTPGRNVPTWKRLRRLRRAIRHSGYDVVLSFCDATNLLVMLSIAGMRKRPPIVLSERSDPARQSLGRVREWLRDRLYPRAEAVVVLSEEVATTLRSRMNIEAVVIPSAVDPPPQDYHALHRSGATGDSPIRLIAIGRVEPEKGFDRLLGALAVLNDSANNDSANNDSGDHGSGAMPAWRLKLLGDGSGLAGLKSFAREHQMESQIEFCGWVDSVWPHLAEADVFVLPSFYEGFPSAMLEAMAGGIAVVAVDAGGGVRAAIRHGENGWMVENAFLPLVEGLRVVCQNEELRQRISQSAPQVVDRFGWDAMVDAYERVLGQAAGKRPIPTDPRV